MRLDHLLSKEDERVDHALSEEVNSGSVLFNFEGSLKREYLEKRKRGFSSAGRAPALQAGGQGFDSLNLHQRSACARIPVSSAAKCVSYLPRSSEKAKIKG